MSRISMIRLHPAKVANLILTVAKRFFRVPSVDIHFEHNDTKRKCQNFGHSLRSKKHQLAARLIRTGLNNLVLLTLFIVVNINLTIYFLILLTNMNAFVYNI